MSHQNRSNYRLFAYFVNIEFRKCRLSLISKCELLSIDLFSYMYMHECVCDK